MASVPVYNVNKQQEEKIAIDILLALYSDWIHEEYSIQNETPDFKLLPVWMAGNKENLNRGGTKCDYGMVIGTQSFIVPKSSENRIPTSTQLFPKDFLFGTFVDRVMNNELDLDRLKRWQKHMGPFYAKLVPAPAPPPAVPNAASAAASAPAASDTAAAAGDVEVLGAESVAASGGGLNAAANVAVPNHEPTVAGTTAGSATPVSTATTAATPVSGKKLEFETASVLVEPKVKNRFIADVEKMFQNESVPKAELMKGVAWLHENKLIKKLVVDKNALGDLFDNDDKKFLQSGGINFIKTAIVGTALKKQNKRKLDEASGGSKKKAKRKKKSSAEGNAEGPDGDNFIQRLVEGGKMAATVEETDESSEAGLKETDRKSVV